MCVLLTIAPEYFFSIMYCQLPIKITTALFNDEFIEVIYMSYCKMHSTSCEGQSLGKQLLKKLKQGKKQF